MCAGIGKMFKHQKIESNAALLRERKS